MRGKNDFSHGSKIAKYPDQAKRKDDGDDSVMDKFPLRHCEKKT
jgi:hypothetical protein